VYWDNIVAAALINDAINAYNAKRYQDALDLYKGVLRIPSGDQLRVHNGIYLATWKLGRRDEAAQAFGRVVDHGLANSKLAIKFLFGPGSTVFYPDPQVSGPYRIWLKQLAAHTVQKAACLEIVGHTSPTGPEPINDRLSLMRAQYIKQRLDGEAAELRNRTRALGKGSKENLVGIGTDDARDALDRRVEFRVVGC
jgi:outer membrane protein OmpA-like peptidoglycan-associated protein